MKDAMDPRDFLTLLRASISQWREEFDDQSAEVIGSEATRALHHEMPMELLRASLPHIDEHQRKLLSDFAHRSMPISGLNTHGGSGGRMNSESVRG
ncbi:unnamed protein product [Malus baccata var. baccata]